MSALVLRTKAEQRLEWFESLRRPLTAQESEELRRSLHATYCRNRKLAQALEAEWNAPALEEHKASEVELLRRLEAEAASLELIPEGQP